MLSAIVFLVLAAEPPTAVVVATEVDADLQQRMQRVTDWSAAIERNVLDATELQRRLTGLATPSIVDLGAMRMTLDTANDREAHFDTAGAIALRRAVLSAYDNAVLPSIDLQVIAATALHDIAAGELAEGRDKEAVEAARTAQRRFPNVPLDAKRHPPQVTQLFRRAAIELKKVPAGELVVTSNKRARVMADGVPLGTVPSGGPGDVPGAVDGKLSVKLQQGIWRIWLADDNGTSLMHAVTVGPTPASVDIDQQLEGVLSWTTTPFLRCGDGCDTLLRRLAKRTGTDEAIGLSIGDDPHAPATGLFVRAADGTVTTQPVVALADLNPPMNMTMVAPPPPSHFSPWSLVPFGVGQVAQKRYVAGGIYAAVQAGLLTWNILESAHGVNEDTSAESDRRKRQNLSAGLFIGAMVANVAEALIVDAVSD